MSSGISSNLYSATIAPFSGCGSAFSSAQETMQVIASKVFEDISVSGGSGASSQDKPVSEATVALFRQFMGRLGLLDSLAELGKIPNFSLHAFLTLRLFALSNEWLRASPSTDKEKIAGSLLCLVRALNETKFHPLNAQKIKEAFAECGHTEPSPEPIKMLSFVLSQQSFSKLKMSHFIGSSNSPIPEALFRELTSQTSMLIGVLAGFCKQCHHRIKKLCGIGNIEGVYKGSALVSSTELKGVEEELSRLISQKPLPLQVIRDVLKKEIQRKVRWNPILTAKVAKARGSISESVERNAQDEIRYNLLQKGLEEGNAVMETATTMLSSIADSTPGKADTMERIEKAVDRLKKMEGFLKKTVIAETLKQQIEGTFFEKLKSQTADLQNLYDEMKVHSEMSMPIFSFLNGITTIFSEAIGYNTHLTQQVYNSDINDREQRIIAMYQDDSYEPQLSRSSRKKRPSIEKAPSQDSTNPFLLPSYTALESLTLQGMKDSPISDDIRYHLSLACMAMTLSKTVGKENPRIGQLIFHSLLRSCGILGEQTLTLNAALKHKPMFYNHRWVPVLRVLNEGDALGEASTFEKMLEFAKKFDQIVISSRYVRVGLSTEEKKPLGVLIENPMGVDDKTIKTVFSRSVNFVAYINGLRTSEVSEEIRKRIDAEEAIPFSRFQGKALFTALRRSQALLHTFQEKEFAYLGHNPANREYTEQIFFIANRIRDTLELIDRCPFQQTIPLFISAVCEHSQLIVEAALKFLAFAKGEKGFETEHDLGYFLIGDNDGITDENEKTVADHLSAFSGINYPFQQEETLYQRQKPLVPGAIQLRIDSFKQWRALQAEETPDTSLLESQMADALSLLEKALKVAKSRVEGFRLTPAPSSVA